MKPQKLKQKIMETLLDALDKGATSESIISSLEEVKFTILSKEREISHAKSNTPSIKGYL